MVEEQLNHKKAVMSHFQLEEMLRAGVHFGHLARRWCPKMKPYIFMEKNGVHIIDLQKTVVLADEALKALEAIAQTGREIMFVGTKKQAKAYYCRAGRTRRYALCLRALAWRHAYQFSDNTTEHQANELHRPDGDRWHL